MFKFSGSSLFISVRSSRTWRVWPWQRLITGAGMEGSGAAPPVGAVRGIGSVRAGRRGPLVAAVSSAGCGGSWSVGCWSGRQMLVEWGGHGATPGVGLEVAHNSELGIIPNCSSGKSGDGKEGAGDDVEAGGGSCWLAARRTRGIGRRYGGFFPSLSFASSRHVGNTLGPFWLFYWAFLHTLNCTAGISVVLHPMVTFNLMTWRNMVVKNFTFFTTLDY